MPTTKEYGAPSEANKKIGGVPEIHYVDFASKGRGQVIRLLFEDAAIAYKDTRYPSDEIKPGTSGKQKIFSMNPQGTFPVLELNGKVLTQSYAILRHLARLLEEYDGINEDEVYWVDAMCDVALDWRTKFVEAFFCAPEERKVKYPEYCKGKRADYMNGLERQLNTNPLSSGGKGFVLGDRITYADLVIYQICHDELKGDGWKVLNDYPRLKKLVDAVEARPNVKKFLESKRYLG